MAGLTFTQSLAANGSTAGYAVPVGGYVSLYGFGTFGGGTLALQSSPDGTNWFNLATITANGRMQAYLNTGERVRGNLTGATAPSVTVTAI